MSNSITEKQLDIYTEYKTTDDGYRAIAQDRDITPSTVRDHVKAVEEKLKGCIEVRDCVGADSVEELLDDDTKP